MKLFFKGEYRITQRAAWPMSYCVREHPGLINPYYKKIVQLLKRQDVHPAVTRNIVRLLQDVKIPAKWQGDIMDLCFGFIANPDAARNNKTVEYEVAHPMWESYRVNNYIVDCDFGSLYGPSFAYLAQAKPESVMLAEGSKISVFNKHIL